MGLPLAVKSDYVIISLMELPQEVIRANEGHKHALDQYITNLQAELVTVNQLIVAVEDLSDDSLLQQDLGDKWCLHAGGALKPRSVIELTEALDEKSPFFSESCRKERYARAIASSPFSASEKRNLEKAVIKQNKRIAALNAQQRGQNAFEAASLEDETFLHNTDGINWASVAHDVSVSNIAAGTRTAQECKVRWLGVQHPKINTGIWSDDEEKQLHDLVESYQESGGLDWVKIAAELNTKRTALECIKRFQACNRPSFRWTSPRDKKLLEAVEKYGSGNWALVASLVSEQVSANQCQIRYERTLNPEIKRGKFSPEEDELLIKAIEAHGQDWVKVAQAIPGRTNTQCRGRYTHHFTEGIVKAPWVAEEDMSLRAAVSKHGHKWDKVREEMGSRRHQSQYAARYRVLMRIDSQSKESPDAALPAGSNNTNSPVTNNSLNERGEPPTKK